MGAAELSEDVGAGSPSASGPQVLELAGGLDLVSGRRLEHVQIAYETFGELDETGSNAVLICHALSGDAHVTAGPDRFGDHRPGWWEPTVGPGRTIDTRKYFVICANVLGGCSGTTGPGSIDRETNTRYGLRFPLVTIEDMVDAQAALIDQLGIGRLACVTGGSMGGMQALTWARRYPNRVAAVAAVATTWRLAAQAIAFNEVGRTAILGDPAFEDGDYYEQGQPSHGLAVARMIGHITYLSDGSMREKFGRRLHERAAHAFEFVTEFEVESYLAYQGRKFVERFDANTYLYMTKAMDYFDLSAGHRTLSEALEEIRSRFLVLSFSSDWLFPTYQARELVDALKAAGAEVSFAEIESPYGHDAFLLESEQLRTYLEPFLARVTRDERERARLAGASETAAEAGGRS